MLVYHSPCRIRWSFLLCVTVAVIRVLRFFVLPFFFFSSRRRHTRSVSAFLLNRSSDLSSKGPKPLQLKLLTTYIPKTSAFTLAFSTSQRLRTTRASARTFFTFRHYITPSARNF